jgi:hypothetical protein
MPDRNISDQIAAKDIVGTWALTDESLKLLKANGYQSPQGSEHTIQLKPDGTCVFRSAVVNLMDATYFELNGKWELKHGTIVDGMKVANELWIDSGTFGITRENGHLRFFSFYGDPDAWQFMEYTREQ